EDQLQPPATAPEFAVRHRLEADALLHRDDLADAFVLHLPESGIIVRSQRARRRLRPEKPLARLLQALGAKQAADLIGAERRAHQSSLAPEALTFFAASSRSCFR